MVNPTTFPILRRGSSGPESVSSGPSGSILPYDNVVYFDPLTVATGENGSIADPFSTWEGWVGGVQVGSSGSWLVQFPGTAITPGADELPVEGINLVIQGLVGSDVGSFINDVITIPSKDDADGIVAFRDLSLEALILAGGDYRLTFRNCVVSDISEVDDFTGIIYGFDTEFLIEMVTPEASVHLLGGSTSQWEAESFVLENAIVGSKDLTSGGAITVAGNGGICRCHGVTFGPGSTITFAIDGELWLDGPSYQSYIDAGVTSSGATVIRDDGNWPARSAEYSGGSIIIDWFSNPRAVYTADEGASSMLWTPPLTREVQLKVIQADPESGHPVAWPANVYWTDGVAPEQDLTLGSISIYRFDYEADEDVYYGWVVGMNFQAP